MSFQSLTKKTSSQEATILSTQQEKNSHLLEQKGVLQVSETVELELKKHYLLELQAEKQYRTLALWARNKNLRGAALCFDKQALGEYTHASWIENHLRIAGSPITNIPSLEETKTTVSSIKEAFLYALSMERQLSIHIIKLRNLAREESNEYTVNFMNKVLIPEQIEEEEFLQKTLDVIDHYLEDGNTVDLDKELGMSK